MVDSLFSSAISGVLKRKFPGEQGSDAAFALEKIWSEVLEAIIVRSQEEFHDQIEELHIDLKPELAVSLANSVYGIAEKIVTARTGNSKLSDIKPCQEREFHYSAAGQALIKGTAKNMTTVWLKRYKVRWGPKSKKKLEKEQNPPQGKSRQVKPVENNHFISKFMLRDFWAAEGNIAIHKRTKLNDWRTRNKPFSQWGFRKNLYSDKLEDRFSLIEGDAREPIRKLLDMYPLNDPEQLAFLGFLIVQKIRNPFYRSKLIERLLPFSTEVVGPEKATDPVFQRKVYETIFDNDEFYDRISRPLLWSKWVVVRADRPVFILPDTASILGDVDGHRILVAPLTPTACFLTSGLPEKEKRVVPHDFRDNDLAEMLNCSLMASCKEEFVSHIDFVDLNVGQPSNLLNDVLKTIRKLVKESD